MKNPVVTQIAGGKKLILVPPKKQLNYVCLFCSTYYDNQSLYHKHVRENHTKNPTPLYSSNKSEKKNYCPDTCKFYIQQVTLPQKNLKVNSPTDIDDNQKDNNNRTVDTDIKLNYNNPYKNFADTEHEEEIDNSSKVKNVIGSKSINLYDLIKEEVVEEVKQVEPKHDFDKRMNIIECSQVKFQTPILSNQKKMKNPVVTQIAGGKKLILVPPKKQLNYVCLFCSTYYDNQSLYHKHVRENHTKNPTPLYSSNKSEKKNYCPDTCKFYIQQVTLPQKNLKVNSPTDIDDNQKDNNNRTVDTDIKLNYNNPYKNFADTEHEEEIDNSSKVKNVIGSKSINLYDLIKEEVVEEVKQVEPKHDFDKRMNIIECSQVKFQTPILSNQKKMKNPVVTQIAGGKKLILVPPKKQLNYVCLFCSTYYDNQSLYHKHVRENHTKNPTPLYSSNKSEKKNYCPDTCKFYIQQVTLPQKNLKVNSPTDIDDNQKDNNNRTVDTDIKLNYNNPYKNFADTEHEEEIDNSSKVKNVIGSKSINLYDLIKEEVVEEVKQVEPKHDFDKRMNIIECSQVKFQTPILSNQKKMKNPVVTQIAGGKKLILVPPKKQLNYVCLFCSTYYDNQSLYHKHVRENHTKNPTPLYSSNKSEKKNYCPDTCKFYIQQVTLPQKNLKVNSPTDIDDNQKDNNNRTVDTDIKLNYNNPYKNFADTEHEEEIDNSSKVKNVIGSKSINLYDLIKEEVVEEVKQVEPKHDFDKRMNIIECSQVKFQTPILSNQKKMKNPVVTQIAGGKKLILVPPKKQLNYVCLFCSTYYDNQSLYHKHVRENHTKNPTPLYSSNKSEKKNYCPDTCKFYIQQVTLPQKNLKVNSPTDIDDNQKDNNNRTVDTDIKLNYNNPYKNFADTEHEEEIDNSSKVKNVIGSKSINLYDLIKEEVVEEVKQVEPKHDFDKRMNIIECSQVKFQTPILSNQKKMKNPVVTQIAGGKKLILVPPKKQLNYVCLFCSTYYDNQSLYHKHVRENHTKNPTPLYSSNKSEKKNYCPDTCKFYIQQVTLPQKNLKVNSPTDIDDNQKDNNNRTVDTDIKLNYNNPYKNFADTEHEEEIDNSSKVKNVIGSKSINLYDLIKEEVVEEVKQVEPKHDFDKRMNIIECSQVKFQTPILSNQKKMKNPVVTQIAGGKKLILVPPKKQLNYVCLFCSTYYDNQSLYHKHVRENHTKNPTPLYSSNKSEKKNYCPDTCKFYIQQVTLPQKNLKVNSPTDIDDNQKDNNNRTVDTDIKLNYNNPYKNFADTEHEEEIDNSSKVKNVIGSKSINLYDLIKEEVVEEVKQVEPKHDFDKRMNIIECSQVKFQTPILSNQKKMKNPVVTQIAGGKKLILVPPKKQLNYVCLFCSTYYDNQSLYHKHVRENHTKNPTPLYSSNKSEKKNYCPDTCKFYIQQVTLPQKNLKVNSPTDIDDNQKDNNNRTVDTDIKLNYNNPYKNFADTEHEEEIDNSSKVKNVIGSKSINLYDLIKEEVVEEVKQVEPKHDFDKRMNIIECSQVKFQTPILSNQKKMKNPVVTQIAGGKKLILVRIRKNELLVLI
ncbi:hypothetical protein QTP88_028604 [Uroleucon formosanum]